MPLNGCLEILGVYIYIILQKRNAAVFHSVCPQVLFVLRIVEDFHPITLKPVA